MAERKTKKKSERKARSWVTIVYPESEKPGWRDILADWHIKAFVSPLHDADTNPETGEPKKPHYHVLLIWDGPVTKKLAEERIKELGGVGTIDCNSPKGYARYLCHLDNPEKHQYSPEAVQSFGGADYMGVIGVTVKQSKILSEMMTWCAENRVTSFRVLCDYARTEKMDTWFETLIKSNSVMTAIYRYLRSMEYDYDSEAKNYKVPKSQDA